MLIECGDCRFWVHGECHRRAPAPLVTGGFEADAETLWPVMADSDFCGDGMPKIGPASDDDEPKRSPRYRCGRRFESDGKLAVCARDRGHDKNCVAWGGE